MPNYKRNHYVPRWYQERFIPPGTQEKKFYYLDLNPEIRNNNGHAFKRSEINRWGPPRCFVEDDLYTTRYGAFESTEIEQYFFGDIDTNGKMALEYFENFTHPDANPIMFNNFIRYMSTQRLRTPKALNYLHKVRNATNKNEVLIAMQKLQYLYCALWAESVWNIIDATDSETKFLLSDHPVTVYNQGYFPGSEQCKNGWDPEIWHSGTHTLFPLSINKILIMTNLSWVRNPYGNPRDERPNPNPHRDTIFNFLSIQLGRKLSNYDVNIINYIIKSRAKQFIASVDKASLYPENVIRISHWDKLCDKHFLMPDPRSITFTSESVVGYSNGQSDCYDEYGRKPGQRGFTDPAQHKRDWITFCHFQGEYARLFGPRRRGVSFEFGRKDKTEDSEEMHACYLQQEVKYKVHKVKLYYTK